MSAPPGPPSSGPAAPSSGSKEQLATVWNSMTRGGNNLGHLDRFDEMNLQAMNARYLTQLMAQRQQTRGIYPQHPPPAPRPGPNSMAMQSAAPPFMHSAGGLPVMPPGPPTQAQRVTIHTA